MISPFDVLNASILIVDDQDANVALLEEMLRGAGYVTVESTKDPHEVCELHRKNHYALILLDIQMPGLDGFQVMEGLKAIEIGGYLPVFVQTCQPSYRLRALKAGAKDFVSKPFDLPEILMRVHNMLEVRLLHRKAALRTAQAEAQFIEVQKNEVIGQLASGVVHDFNNMLAVIMGYSDLIVQELGPDDRLHKHVAQIRLASERAAGLTQQLLVFSRRQTITLMVLDLDAAVNDLGKMLRRLIDENIEMTIVPGKEIGRVMADSGSVGQLVMNLVVNARDAMPHGGKLIIATNNVTLDESYARTHSDVAAGEYVMLSVSDTGTGMTDEVKSHLFETFFTTKPKGKGTGLGLAICQTIVQQSGGHISFHSNSGEGTTFNVYFPRVEQPLDVAAPTISTGPLPRGTETLLVVEDEPSVLHLAREVLETQGYEVLSAANGQDALRVARGHKGAPIRLVVTDVIMPLMSGKATAERLKVIYPALKMLFISGYTDNAIVHNGVVATGVDFLSKPFTPATLARKVREILDVSAGQIQ